MQAATEMGAEGDNEARFAQDIQLHQTTEPV